MERVIIMSDMALIQFRVDKELKQEVSDICEALGTDMPTVFRMCMKQMQISRGIPFSTKLPENVVTRSEALNAFNQLRKEASDAPEMSLDEINEEIEAARADRKARKAAAV
jgi:addiction module RelB/DinJ family antitoxin